MMKEKKDRCGQRGAAPLAGAANTFDAYDRLVVIDLEATCSDDDRFPRDEMETIEFGAVMLDTRSFEPLEEFQSFVRPVRHPRLTSFCSELTGITQEKVEDAPLFPEALDALVSWMKADERKVLFGSWGAYDRRQLTRDCAFHKVRYPMPDHINLKEALARVQGRHKQYGMARALRLCGLDLEGDHHRALDDARNISRMLPWITGQRRLSG